MPAAIAIVAPVSADLPLGLLQPAAGRGRPRDRRGARARARAPAEHARDDRVGELRPGLGARVPGLGPHQQVRRGLSGQALLRRLRVRRHRRAAGDRPRQVAVRRRARQRPAARRRAGQHRRLPGAARSRRLDDGTRALPRRPPHPRDAHQRLREALRDHPLPRRSRDQPDRHGRGRPDRARVPAEADPRRLVGVPADPRLRALPRDRRRRRRLPGRRHGALRRAGRGGPAPQPGAVRRRGHDHDPQDDRRRPRRHDPVPRGVRQADRLRRVPGPAGRPARAHHRRQGRGAADRGVGAVPRAPGADAGGRAGGGRGAVVGGSAGSAF